MNWNDPILFDFYSGNLPRYQQRPGTVNPDAIRAYMMGLPGRAPKQAPKSVPKGLTQIPAQDQFYQNQLQKYGRTREDIARSQQEAALPFLLATGAIGAAAAAPLLAMAAPAIASGLAYAPVASAPGATLGNLIAAAGATDFALNRAPRIPGQIARGEYGEAALNAGLGALDLYGANMISPGLVSNAAQLANQGRRYVNRTYRNIAEGDNIFNYAWRSPAAGITDDVASRMYQQTRNSIPLDESAKDIISEYQHTSGPFTGRFESGNVNLTKRLELENAIAERNLVTQSGKPNVLIRRFDPNDPELYSLNKSGQFILDRPTSWSVGRGSDYTSKPNRIVFKLPSGSRGMLNEYNAAKYDQDVSKLMVEREAVMGSGLNLGKRLGKVKNEFGGYDYIHRFKGYDPTEYDDIRRLNTENIGEIVDLSKNLASGRGNFNLGVYPFFKNPNILLKLGKVSQNEQFGINNKNVLTGIPQSLRDMPTEAWGKIAIPFHEVNLTGLTSKTLNRPVIPDSEILGSVMQRVKGKPLYEYSLSDLENIQPWDYQDLANSVKHLINKGSGVDFYGDNIFLNKSDYGMRFNLFDIGPLPNTNTGSFPVGPLYGLDAEAFSKGVNRIDPKMIKNILQEKMRRAVYESAANAGEGAYSDQEIFDAIQKINNRIQNTDIRYKKGGPIINQRGFMDGAPPKGSNWRIMGDGRGTSITMDLPNMPDEILVVPDGDFDKAKVMKQGQEEYFMGADFVDEYLLGQGGTTGPKIAVRDYPTMKSGGLSANKAREILHHGQVHGHKLTDKQRRFFGAMSKGHTNKFQFGGGTTMDSLRHQANKILQYEQLRGGPGGTPLPGYSDPRYMDMLINNIYPEVRKIMPNASAMEAAEAMDFIFNAGWDQAGNKITKDPRAYALQEYYRQYDPSKLDADGKWSGRKNPAYSFDQEYASTIGKLPENSRRVLMNKGRDWYYKNINNPSPGVPNSNYYDTWYGRIWNTNDFQPFNPNNPKFVPKRQTGGGYGVFGYAPHMQIGGKTDDEKRALAKRVTEIARRRAENNEWVNVPQSIVAAADKLGEDAYSCIGGVCDVLKEADVIPNVIWSNTEFAKQAPKLGFNAANRGWGLKGIENLEPGDVVQWMDRSVKSKKAVPHHGQIYLGTNKEGDLEFFDNFNKEIRSYPKERIEEQLSWTRKPGDDQMQIYKINPYNPKPGSVNPEAQKALEQREANLMYQTDPFNNAPAYEYSLRPDSPYYNNPPTGMVKFMEKANNPDFISDVIKSVDKAGYAKRATREQVHDALLNVFGILGQENKWENPWIGGDVAPSFLPQIPLESTIERIASPSSMSIGPGQIKFSQINKAVKKAFGINRRQDLQNWDKVIPLMVGMDIANKQWMENQGEKFSERMIGQPGLTSQQFKWDEGRMSPYFWRGPGVKNVRKYVESLYGKDWYDEYKPQYLQTLEEMEEDPVKREQFVKENIRQYQKVFDPGSYGQRVFENINRNLQRKLLREGDIDVESTPENAPTLQEVILNSKRPPRRQLGGNALAMLRDYGAGISVPRLY